MVTNTSESQDLSQAIAETILHGFDKHFAIFHEFTAGAKKRFEHADWKAEQLASRQRILLYDKRVDEAIEELNDKFALQRFNEPSWKKVKQSYIQLLQDHNQPELAETFYTSLFCRQFDRKYFNNNYIFVRSAVSTEYIESDRPAYHVYYPKTTGLRTSIETILQQCKFELPFENVKRDVRNITKALCEHFQHQHQTAHLNFQLQVISATFFRNKAAYVVGKAINDTEVIPFALPILNNEQGALYVDALLIGEDALSQLFDFSYVYFMVTHPVPSAVVAFLQSLMPDRSTADLYSAIGYHKHGKTVFYRDFLHHLKYSDDELIVAPGIKGMVMAVFTLPSYSYVFKVIRDRFAPPKEIERKTVERKYQLVKQHDRVGRMADMLEYSNVAFPKDRFSKELLDELVSICASSIEFDDALVVIKHIYIERRMTPLNLDIAGAEGEYLEKLLRGYGKAIKELAAANIFPGDMLFKNFGVTPLGRVVFYDYDEISYLTECNFRKIPAARHPEDELSGEPWYSVAPNDVFPEEFATFLLTSPEIRKAFMKYHADLLEPEFWWQKQENIKQGIFEQVFPYPESARFKQK